MVATTLVSSAGGMLAMLNEPHLSLKLHALSNLINLVDSFWPEISTSVPLIIASPLEPCAWGCVPGKILEYHSPKPNNAQMGHSPKTDEAHKDHGK
ncbi:26S proteasome non-ATPase regulatory subunit, partial [Trifolium medium]|nr:26S proteasome non-ATPase regulatory subunit [Trifolium medium]